MTPGKKRQASYRARMLAEGKRQYSFWLTSEQAAVIRAYLSGETSLLTPVQAENPPQSEPISSMEPAKSKPRAGKVTTRPGTQENETQVWRDGRQIGSIYKRRIDGHPRSKIRYEAYRYGRIIPLATYRTKREAVAALSS